MKRLALIIAFVLSPVLDVLLSAQNEIAVVGCVLDKTDKTPIKNVRVWAYNTSYEAKDKKIYLEKMIEANSTDLINMEGIETATNEEGYFEINVSPTGGLVFYLEMADPVEVDVLGRNKITVQMLRGAMLDESKITAEGGPEPTFDIPEGDGETISGGATFPLLAHKDYGRNISRMVFQTYLIDVEAGDTVLFRTPKVQDGEDYHQTQLRRMGFEPERDPLFCSAEKYPVLTEETELVTWKDTVSLPDPRKLYLYNCSLWLEDYNKVYYEIKDTTIFRSDRLAIPMRFLEYQLDDYQLDPDKYRKQPRKESMPTAGKLNLKFLIGRAELDRSDAHSMAVLDSVRTYLHNGIEDGATLKELHFVGVASPDGNYARNVDLANKRMKYVSDQMLSGIPAANLRYTNRSQRSRVARWEEVAELLEKDSLIAEAEAVKRITEKYPVGKKDPSVAADRQFMAIRALPFYKDKIAPRLEALRSVNFTSVMEVVRALTPEEILQKYNTDEDYRNGRMPVPLYEYWHLFKMVKNEDELLALYRQAYRATVKVEPWELPANNLAVALLKRGEVDTTILAPFIDLRRPVNFEYKIGSRVERTVNVEQILANQVKMMIAAKKFARAGQMAMRLPDNEKYHDLKQVTMCLAGYWKKEKALREDIIKTSKRNAVVMYMAMNQLNKAAFEADSLSEEDPVTFYLRAQIDCCLHQNDFFAMQDDVDVMTNVSSADKSAYNLALAFKKDESLIEVAKSDYYIHEKLLELALKYYKDGTNPFDSGLSPEELELMKYWGQ